MKSFVAVEQHVCPACGRSHDTGSLLMDKRGRERFDSMHTVTGWGLCPEHQKMVDDGYRLFVAIDRGKSSGNKPGDVYRTGPIAGVRTAVADEILPGSAGHTLCWVEPEVIEALQTMPVAPSN